MTSTSPQALSVPEQLLAAAQAVAGVLPATSPLSVGPAVPGDATVTHGLAGAVVAELALPGAPRLAVLVGQDLVSALAASPLGGLDLAAAAQPALDAAAEALGTRCDAGRAVDLSLVVHDLGEGFSTLPLVDETTRTAGALLVSAALLGSGAPVTPALADLPRAEAPAVASIGRSRGIEMLHGVDMEVTVELGRARMTVRDLLALAPGAVLELDRAAGSPADLLVNGRLIARGEVVVVDEDFGLRVTEILDESAAG